MPSFKIIGLPDLEKKIFKGFTIYGRGGHLGHVSLTIYTKFGSPSPRRHHIKFALIGQAVSEKIFENAGWTDDDGRRTPTDGRQLDGYTISPPCEPNGSCELIKLGCKRVYIISLIFALKQRLCVLVRTATLVWFLRVPTICVLSKNEKKHNNFYLKSLLRNETIPMKRGNKQCLFDTPAL